MSNSIKVRGTYESKSTGFVVTVDHVGQFVEYTLVHNGAKCVASKRDFLGHYVPVQS